MSEMPAVEMKGVSFSYNGRPAIEDASFEIPMRDFAGIVGPNGGGKTTLLRLMLGLLSPSSGEVRVLGHRPADVVRRIGYVAQGFQYDRSLPISARDVVTMALLGKSSAGRHERAMEALERVGMADLADRRFADASAGQQQRVLIARALATDPEMLMLDEPTASLDAAAEREIYALLQELNAQMTIIVVTHDLGFVSNVVRSVLCVNRQVRRHPTSQIREVTGDYLEEMYGRGRLLVRHDRDFGEAAPRD